MKQPTATLKAYCFAWVAVMATKPSGNFHFWCLKQLKNINWWVIKKISEKFAFQFCFSLQNSKQKFWKFSLTKFSPTVVFFYNKFQFRMSPAFIWSTYCRKKKKRKKYDLRSTGENILKVPNKPTVKCSRFSYYGAKLYNLLPTNIKATVNSSTFKNLIKEWIWTNIPSY